MIDNSFAFSMITNDLFYKKDNKGNDVNSIYLDTKDYKTLLVLHYLYLSVNRFNKCLFSIESLLNYYNIKIDTHKGKSVEQIRNILIYLHKIGMIECNINIAKVKYNTLIQCEFNPTNTIFDEENDIELSTQFVKLPLWVVNRIMDYKETKINNTQLLFYWCYLECRKYKYYDDTYNVRNGGRATVTYVSMKKITKDTNITDTTIKKYNDILVKLNLLRIGNCGLCFNKSDLNNGNKIVSKKESINIYCTVTELTDLLENDKSSNTLDQIRRGVNEYKNKMLENGYIVLEGREYKNNNKSISGYIGRINYLDSIGKATDKQIEQRDFYLNRLNEIEKDTDTDKSIWNIDGNDFIRV